MLFINEKLLLLICALIGIVRCEPNQIIKDISPPAVRSVGDNVELTCTVENPNDYVVIWSKKDRENPSKTLPLSILTQLTIKDPRFNLTTTPNSISLHISNIEYGDASLYECQVIVSQQNVQTATVELLIRHPPKISQVIEIAPSVASLNGSAELKCTADGYPKPEISWIRENDKILPSGGHIYNGSILKVTHISIEDRGLYYCIADNHIEPVDKRSVNFEVQFSPIIFVSRPKVAQAIGYDIEMECRVEGFPAPSIIWLKDGNQLHDDSAHSITTTATQNAISISVLHIITVEQEQFGDYECKAENKLGSAKATINLFESLVAVFPWQAIGRN